MMFSDPLGHLCSAKKSAGLSVGIAGPEECARPSQIEQTMGVQIFLSLVSNL